MATNISPHNPRDLTSLGQGRRARQVHGATGATETISLANGSLHHITLDANCTLTFALDARAETDGWTFDLMVKQDGTGSRTITWPASVKWPAATAPTLTTTAGRTDWLRFTTADGGTNWLGEAVALNYTEA